MPRDLLLPEHVRRAAAVHGRVVLRARLGRAVLWPSVTSADPSVDEPNTNHEGLPPERGVKYAANAWIHNFDYRTPAAANCVLAHRNSHSPIF